MTRSVTTLFDDDILLGFHGSIWVITLFGLIAVADGLMISAGFIMLGMVLDIVGITG